MTRTQPQKKRTKTKQRGRISNYRSLFLGYWRRAKWPKKALIIFCALLVFWVGVMYTTAQVYIFSQRNKPIKYGVTFIAPYARYFDLDDKATMQAMIDELGIRQFRLVSYWDVHEANRGTYDFSELDWQMKKAEASGSKVSLAIGLRQPRWPECHIPKWAEALPMSEWSVELKKFMGVTIERYKNSPALESYQLENEFFLDVFGICPDFTRERLIDEYNYVKGLDSTRPVVVSRSNNAIGLPLGKPRPDVSGVSVYKRVWDKTLTKRYIEYPFPAWFYGSLAGGGKLFTGRDLIIHELQAEPWMPEGDYKINRLSDIAEQDKSMNAERLRDRIEYGKATGMKEIYLWGAEWWYWRKVKANDPSIWNAAAQEIKITDQQNQKLLKN